ncbi:hypothetical protein B0A48_11867 [Cryoendolithus antarcticus]|uniref:Peptidase A1 domain-containing protein n=1 Tax=Cryoendolithus antarcticus TaxID=1507870 RepID=A0A1V8ST19_9PEZI|nr:hypothetical protein B0A48_11867 [Cryoendolithus antarcticus]
MSNKSVNATIPAPHSWQPSTNWDGNDGYWNSFIVRVGTPLQDFRILPSTAGQETWVLNPQGCVDEEHPPSCPYVGGAIPPSVGLDVNTSSTWLSNGIFTLNAQEEQFGYTGNGLYGFHTVVLGTDDRAMNLSHQVLASMADKSYLLGQFGLGPKPINSFNEPIPNYLTTLVNFSTIPSLSFGYTAGAAYRNKMPASLTLGGHDSNRFSPANLSITMNVHLIGDVDLLPEGTFHFVDSTIPHTWLPQDAVNAFVSTFGPSYDSSTGLFLINDTEAYVTADWERQNCSIAQTSFDKLNNEHLIAINSPTRETAATTIAPNTNTKGLSKGVIAGIAIGALLLTGAAIHAVVFCIRRRREQQARNIAEDDASRGTTHGTPALHEHEVKPMLPYAKPEMPSDHAVNELPASADPVEVDGKSQAIPSHYLELPAGSDAVLEHTVNPNARERQARVSYI